MSNEKNLSLRLISQMILEKLKELNQEIENLETKKDLPENYTINPVELEIIKGLIETIKTDLEKTPNNIEADKVKGLIGKAYAIKNFFDGILSKNMFNKITDSIRQMVNKLIANFIHLFTTCFKFSELHLTGSSSILSGGLDSALEITLVWR